MRPRLSSAHVQHRTADEIYDQVKELAPGTQMSKQTARQISKEMGNDPQLQNQLAGYTNTGGTHQTGVAVGRDIDPSAVRFWPVSDVGL